LDDDEEADESECGISRLFLLINVFFVEFPPPLLIDVPAWGGCSNSGMINVPSEGLYCLWENSVKLLPKYNWTKPIGGQWLFLVQIRINHQIVGSVPQIRAGHPQWH
jgi:hypothetical protein